MTAEPSLARRVGLTLLIPFGVLFVDRFPLPGIHPERLGTANAGAILGLFAFGLNPAVAAALFVEVAALMVRRWRSLRHGDPGGRARLDSAALLLTVALASVQAFFIYRWLQRSADLYEGLGLHEVIPNHFAGRLVICMSIVTGTVILVGLTRVLDARGIGSGFSVLLAAMAGANTVNAVRSSLVEHPLDDDMARALAAPLLILVGLAVATAWHRRGEAANSAAQWALPPPISSLLPLNAAIRLLALGSQLAVFGVTIPSTVAEASVNLGVRATILAALVVACAWLFSRPKLVAPLWQRVVRDEVEAQHLSRRAFHHGLLMSLIYLGIMGGVVTAIGRTRLALDVFAVVTVLCVALDVANEWRFRRTHPDVARIWAEHRLYAVTPVLARLDAAGIPSFPRALRHRTLLAFLGPYIPVEILVPATRAAEARSLIESLLLAPIERPMRT